MTDWFDVARQHGPVVWKTAYRILGNEADAADCFQETFLAALKVCRDGEVKNWPGLLRHLAAARALDRLRQRIRQGRYSESTLDWSCFAESQPGPDQNAEASELAGGLRQALAALPPRESQVFCLRCLEELSYEEIAAQIGLTVNAVGVLLNRARGRLRKLLEGAGYQTMVKG